MFFLKALGWMSWIVALTWALHRLFPLSREATEKISRRALWR